MWRLIKQMNRWRLFLALFTAGMQIFGMVAMPTITANIIDYGVSQGNLDYIYSQGINMLIVTVISIIGAVSSVYIIAKETQTLGMDLRNSIFDKVVNFSKEQLDTYGTSTLITRSTNDTMLIQLVLMNVIRIGTLDPLLIFGAGLLSFVREPKLALVFLVTFPLLAIAVYFIIRAANPLFHKIQQKNDLLNRLFREGLTGIRVIRAFRKDKYEFDRFDKGNQEFKNISLKARTILAFMMPINVFIVSITNIGIIWFGAQYVSSGTMQVGNLVAFLTYAGLIMMGIMMFSQALAIFPRGQIAAERIIRVLNTKDTISDPESPESLETDGKVTLAFDDVSFGYPNEEDYALKDIDFHLTAGQTLAIIGGTGSGKSSLANLIVRLYDVDYGSIKVNDHDIRYVTQKELRDLIGFAPQEAILFEGTIRDNMQYGNPDATDEEIWHALDIAQGSDFVSKLPGELDAHVEHGGGNFSGGQQQRLSIARALVTDARILVFDDSFSALDFKTDAKLRAALKPETQDRAVMIIAQRISTVVDADEIIVLDEGRIVGKGTHEYLKETNTYYQEIIDSQLKGDDI